MTGGSGRPSGNESVAKQVEYAFGMMGDRSSSDGELVEYIGGGGGIGVDGGPLPSCEEPWRGSPDADDECCEIVNSRFVSIGKEWFCCNEGKESWVVGSSCRIESVIESKRGS